MNGHAKLLVAGLALAALAGCGLVVGSGDYKVGIAAPDAGSSGSDDAESSPDVHVTPGPDASPPADDSGGSVVDEGGAPAGDGGLAVPDSGGAGHCGSSIPTGSSDFRKLVNTCVQAVDCDWQQFPVNVSDCVTQNYLQATGSVACLSTISDCTGYYNCQGDRVATPTECGPSDFNGKCVSNVATTCFGAPYLGSVQNCEKLGGTCQTYDDEGDQAAGCKVVPSCNDDDVDGDFHCSGNKLYTCFGGVGFGKDCTAINATCQDPGGGGASCIFNSTSCAIVGSTCNNGDVNLCTNVSQEYDYECSRAGLTCETDDAGAAACVSPGCPLPSDSPCLESCADDGVTANLCVGGATLTLDCSEFGFNACNYDSIGNFAYCTY